MSEGDLLAGMHPYKALCHWKTGYGINEMDVSGTDQNINNNVAKLLRYFCTKLKDEKTASAVTPNYQSHLNLEHSQEKSQFYRLG